MVSAANIYYSSKVKAKLEPNLSVLKKASNYVVKLLTIFGVFDSKDSSTSTDSLLPCLQTMSVFRDNVRKVAISNQDTKLILDLCDKLRDVELPEHGVSIEDREGGPALLKLVDKQVLLAQRAEKQLKMEQAAASKLAAKQQQEKARLELLEKAKIKPIDLFKTSEYSEWDAEGLPTKTSDGQEVSKSRRKKLAKEMDNQQKLHLKYYS